MTATMEALVAQYPRLLRKAWHMTVRDYAHDPEDLVQDAYLKMLEVGALERCDTDVDAYNYAARTITNRAMDLCKRFDRHPWGQYLLELPDFGPTAEEIAVARVLIEEAASTMGDWGPMILLRSLGYTKEQVGEAFGISPTTVETRSWRWRERQGGRA
jgi:RNA polymerase sigma factor (sigma-70 family)